MHWKKTSFSIILLHFICLFFVMPSIQIIWHKNPDTDCTLSAIIMADFLSLKGYDATAYIQGELNKETLYVLEKYDISTPALRSLLDPDTEVCLVDHNENSQAPDNISELNITWLIDHHKIQFSSPAPLFIRTEALCSTASILYKMYREAGFSISQKIATMMLACMMSDSLLWKSPTTTPEDKEIAKELQKIAEIPSLEEFAMPMFHAKSDLGDMPAKEVIQYDYKIFDFGNTTCWVGTLETTNPQYALGRKQELLDALSELKQEQNLDFIMLSVVDIIWENNITFALDGYETEVIEKVFAAKVESNMANLWARLSRKKQIIPDLTAFFS